MTIDDVSHAMELSGGGGGLSWSPPGFRQCGQRRPWLGTLLECPHDDVGIRPVKFPAAPILLTDGPQLGS